jgi:hypothetical protein
MGADPGSHPRGEGRRQMTTITEHEADNRAAAAGEAGYAALALVKCLP